jgi:SulP family sulfate permease
MKDELRSERLLPSLATGLLIGVNEVIFAISIGSLLFSGELSAYFPYGIGIALVTTTVMLVTISLGSSVRGLTGAIQDGPSVILAVIAVALADGALSGHDTDVGLTTVLAAIATAALLTGVVFVILGAFKLGELIRFIPYPVVGGFLGGAGLLLVRGSFGVMADFSLAIPNLPDLLQPDQLMLWIPGTLFALVLLFGLRRYDHFLTMPAILAGAIGLFYLLLLFTGTSVGEATEQGLLMGEVSGEVSWRPLALSDLVTADWTSILGQGGNITIIIVSLVSLLLNASALELVFQQDIDLNRELMVAGIGNMLSGLGGGAVSYHALDLSTLCYRTGARSRLVGLVGGAIGAAVLFVGSPLLALFPRPLLGGLLLFMGLGFLVEWVIDARSKLPRADYGVVLLILVVISATDFLVGVGVGLLAAVTLFVLRYSRIGIVRHALSGAEMRSNVERFSTHRRLLTDLGQRLYILELQGFIFFGTSNALLNQIRARVADKGQPQVHYIVLDFRRVTGLDCSAVISFIKIRRLAEANGITLALAHISEEHRQQFEQGGLSEGDLGVRFFSDLDRSLEWCEDQLLETAEATLVEVPVTLSAQLAGNGFEGALTTRLMTFLQPVEVEKGEYLIRQGDKADDLYFIERGTVSIYLELTDTQPMRMRTLGPGTVVGEVGMYLEGTRTASIVADSPAAAYRLTRSALSAMKKQEPGLTATFHEFLVRQQAERLAGNNLLFEALYR